MFRLADLQTILFIYKVREMFSSTNVIEHVIMKRSVQNLRTKFRVSRMFNLKEYFLMRSQKLSESSLLTTQLSVYSAPDFSLQKLAN